MISKTLSEILAQSHPEVLYHYTTGQGYLGIIQSRELWATNIHYLNDASEFKLASKLTENVLKKIRNSENEELLKKILLGLESYEKVNICVVSFSEEKDQLSQWRAYGGEFGFSIGFKVDRLVKVAERNGFSLAPCCYDANLQEKLILDIIEHFVAKFKTESVKVKDTAGFEAVSGSLGLDCAKEITKVAPILKHESFREEKEWRLISELKSTREMDFRVGKSMLIPFYHLKLKNEDVPLDIINKIYVGPTPHPIEARTSATALLSSNNFDGWSVYFSSTPYRNW